MENKIKALQQGINILRNIIETANYFKEVQFFKAPPNEETRHRYENYHSIPRQRIEFNDNVYTVTFSVLCTSSEVFAYGTYTRNGDECSLTVIENLLTRLECELGKCVLDGTKFGGADNAD